MESENIEEVTAFSTEGGNSVAVEINGAAGIREFTAQELAKIEQHITWYSQDALKLERRSLPRKHSVRVKCAKFI
jgi:fructose-specific phosphotransferase system component IIB